MTPTLVMLLLTTLTLANAMIIAAFLILESREKRVATTAPNKSKNIQSSKI